MPFPVAETWPPGVIQGCAGVYSANEEFGITLFVIEHNMRVIMNLAEHIYCLAHGELLADPDVGRLFLGG